MARNSLLFQGLHPALLRQVASDLGEAAQLAAAVVDGRDHHVGPEAGPVLADAPPFVLEASGGARPPQLLVRPAPSDGVCRIEPREVLADDLRGTVALDPLRAQVPARHAAIGVQHEDRVVLHGLDHEPEAFFALAHLLFLQAALGEVARDLGETDQLPSRLMCGCDHDVGPEPRSILPDPPPFVLEAALGARDLQLEVRPSAGKRVGGIEDGEVFADDLVGTVELHPLRAHVPARHDPLGVDREDRVVVDALQEQPELLFADPSHLANLVGRRLGRLGLGHHTSNGHFGR
jgi:hypothetical protein